MVHRILPLKFFYRNTKIIAKELLGKYLVRKSKGKNLAFMITDVEVYDGFNDLASHASKKRTPRNEVMFQSGGRWYIYFVYGMHSMLNIVTREKDYPAAILIRGLEGISGPGKVTKILGIDKSLNKLPANRKSGLWIEDRGIHISPKSIKKSPRIGINFAGKIWATKPLRYYI
ncbi:MAG TPA: DNA-3-methyladenine glycosylase [Candidatus Paceibacterota bacterium]|nr:DNA-3-methyladenine glycosylase [Candidatus Paceibacterota bacterium]